MRDAPRTSLRRTIRLSAFTEAVRHSWSEAVIFVKCPPGRRALRDWVCAVVLKDWLGQDYELQPDSGAAGWTLSVDEAPGELRLPDVLLGLPDEQWLQPASLPRLPLGQWPLPAELQLAGLPRELPVLYGGLLADRSWLRVGEAETGLEVELGVDVLGGILFMLSRYEEYVILERDVHGRFPPERSIVATGGALLRPLANEYAELLWKLLGGLWPALQRAPRCFRLCPTHDIDYLFGVHGASRGRHLQQLAADLLVRRDLDLLKRRWLAREQVAHGRLDADVNNNFAWLMNQAEMQGTHATFYFLADDAHYPLEHPWLAQQLQQIAARGHRIGLHPPLGTAFDQLALAACTERFRQVLAAAGLGQLARGPLCARQHYFQWSAPETWRAYAAAGLSADSSCYYAPQAGFRCGSCWSFQPCDLRSAEALPLREEPLIAMEHSLLAPKYAGLSLAGAAERLLGLGRACRAVQGEFVLLWHNDKLVSAAQQRAYCAVMAGLS